MTLLTPHYDPWLVGISVLIASFASFVTLDLAKRVRGHDRRVARAWGVGGSLAMGSGIWAMHFVGMMAFSLPVPLGYTHGLTALSWVAAVAVSGIALTVASHGRLTLHRLAGGALAMGGGICAMHYIGMAALDLAPGIVWNPWAVAASAVIAVAASAAALAIFFLLRRVADRHGLRYQLAAALVMGLAISGMHYTGMAAASFPAGTVCLSAGALGGSSLGGIVILASVTMLALTLFTSTLDGRLRDQTTRLAGSLQAANDELKAANAALQTLAFQDPLTGLANRLLFEDRLQHAVARIDRQRGAQRLAVLFIDLDGFKPVNDSLGHAQGDVLLRDAAARLRGVARQSDTVARVGGDEFVLMMEETGGTADCIALAQRLVAALSEPFDLGGQHFGISASVGIVIYPDNGAANKLLAHADAAMYEAKRAGGGGYVLFEPHMDVSALEQLSLQTDLRHAIERNELQLHYQPKISVLTGEVAGVEALLRWLHPVRGMVGPGVFIPIAERFGLINALGNWVIDEACRQMGEWAAAGQRQHVAINVSVHQLRQDDLAARIEAALQRHGVDPADLLCEITESAAMDDLRRNRQAFDRLLRIGVYLSIDDFGTGYSSLSYLRQLPARQLKIDRSFVNDLEGSADARAVVKAVLSVAHALGLRVVAEGVETAGQSEILGRMGCDELQGYHFARPMPPQALPAWATRYSAERFANEVEPVLAEEHLAANEAGRRAEHAA
jgi:diguanylate cyclase (GGDEF)-like protein